MKKYVIGMAFLFGVNLAFGQEMTDRPPSDWEFTVAPYMFFGSVSGDSRLGTLESQEVDLKFKDVLKNLQFAFMLHGEVHKGNWGLMADYFYLKLGSDIDTPESGVLDIEFKQSIFELFGSYRIQKEWGWYDVYAGIRSWNLKLDLQLRDDASVGANGDQNWVDPVIGGRIYYKSPGDFILGMRADLGGFGLGSDFTYNLQPGVGYQFSDVFTLMLQYKYLYSDYSSGTEGTPNFFALDAATNGPLLGLVFRF